LRAVALKPGWADARATLGSLLFHIGLFPEAMHEMEVALSLDPTNGFVTYRIPRIMWQQQRFDDALLAYRSNRVRGKAAASAEEAMVLGYLGRAPEGMALLDSLATTQATLVSDIAAVRAALLARMGKASDAREQIRIAESAGASISHFHHAAYAIAVASALLGDSRGAVTWLERTARDGMPALALFENDPALAQVRRTPEYAALRTRLAAERDGYRRIMSAAAYSTRDNNP
jgi:tetratricopeptide (TPR) repeat protein